MRKISFPKSFILLAILLLNSAVIFAQDSEINLLGKWITGSWDTFAQVEQDEENDTKYKHIRALLHVVPVSINELKDGLAFYVENQDSANRPRPYRQRIYYLFRQNGKIILRIFRIKDDKDFINAHKNPSTLKTLTFDRLTAEEGCDLTYEKVNKNLFKGKTTGGKSCKSTLRGATWTHSDSEISADKWTNLDQGFDDVDNHKWEPPPGTVGHIFRRAKNF